MEISHLEVAVVVLVLGESSAEGFKKKNEKSSIKTFEER